MTELIVKLFVKDAKETKNPMVRERYGVAAGFVCIAANLLLSAAKFLIGFLSGSIAIQADAVNNLSDVSSSAVMIFGAKAANKPADSEHPYGHARLEYIIALGIAAIILIVGVSLGRESIGKIITPEPVEFSIATIAVLVVSILIKLWMGAFSANIGRRIDSETMIASSKDSLSDVAATGAILLSCVVAMIFKVNIDGYMGVIAACFVIYSGIGIIKDTISPLLGEKPNEQIIGELSARLLSYDGIIGLHDIMVHSYGPGNTIATAHAEVRADCDLLKIHETIDRAEREVGHELNVMLTLHLDPIEVDNEELNKARDVVEAEIADMSEIQSLHDFRMVNGEQNINLIFDIVVKPGTAQKDCQELPQRIAQRVRKANPIYSCVIKVDFDYT